jgi:hypothetical protein
MNQNLIYYIIIFLIIGLKSYSQTDCQADLAKAVELYNDGLYTEVIDVLTKNIKTCNYSKHELEQARKLLASAYFEIDEIEKGNELMYKILKINPTIKINQALDPQPFIEDFQKFEIEPAFLFRIGFGMSTNRISVSEVYSVLDGVKYENSYERSLIRPCGDIGVQWNFLKKVSLNINVGMVNKRFARRIPLYDSIHIEVSKSSWDYSIPIYLKYRFSGRKNFFLSIYAGMNFTGMILSTNEVIIDGGQEYTAISKQESLQFGKDQINRNKIGITFGGCLNYKVNKFQFFLDLGYSMDMKDNNVKQNRYSYQKSIFDYYYIEDDIRFRTLELKLGFYYTLAHKVKYKY